MKDRYVDAKSHLWINIIHGMHMSFTEGLTSRELSIGNSPRATMHLRLLIFGLG
jgi:hypothetical protein